MSKVWNFWKKKESTQTETSTVRSSRRKSGDRWSWFWRENYPSRVRSGSIESYTSDVSRGSCHSDYCNISSSECVIKIAVLGDPGVGKTSIIDRYCFGLYNVNHIPTVGPELKIKVLDTTKPSLAAAQQFQHGCKVYFQELPFPETQSPQLENYISDSDGVILVGSLNQPIYESSIDELLIKVRHFTKTDIPVGLFLHKSDSNQKFQAKYNGAELKFAREAGLSHIAMTTCTDIQNIELNINRIISQVLSYAALGSYGTCVFPEYIGRSLSQNISQDQSKSKRMKGGKVTSNSSVRNIGINVRCHKQLDVDVGKFDEERIRLVERQLLAFLNMHTQYLGDYKKPLSSTGRLSTPHNSTRVDISNYQELDLQRECEKVLSRLRKLTPQIRRPTGTSVRDLESSSSELLHIIGYFYTYLVPLWGSITSTLPIESTIAQCRGMARAKPGIVNQVSQQGTAVVQPPPVFYSFLRSASERYKDYSGQEDSSNEQRASSVSSDATLYNTMGTSIASSTPHVGVSGGSWEGGLSHGVSFTQSGVVVKPLSLSVLSEVKSPDFSTPGGVSRQGSTSSRMQADRDFLKILSQSRPDIRHLKEYLHRTHHGRERIRTRSPASGPQGFSYSGRPRAAPPSEPHAPHINDETTTSKGSTSARGMLIFSSFFSLH